MGWPTRWFYTGWVLSVLALFITSFAMAQEASSTSSIADTVENMSAVRPPSGVSMEKALPFGMAFSESVVPLDDGGFALIRLEKPLKRIFSVERYASSLEKRWSQTFKLEKIEVNRESKIGVRDGKLALFSTPDFELADGMLMSFFRGTKDGVEFVYSVGRTVYRKRFALESGEITHSVLGQSPDPKGTAGIVVSEDHSRFALVFYGNKMRNMGISLRDADGEKIRDAVLPVPELVRDKERGGIAALSLDRSGSLFATLRASEDELEIRSFSAEADSPSVRIRSPFPYIRDVLLVANEKHISVAAWTGMKKRKASAVLLSRIDRSSNTPVYAQVHDYALLSSLPKGKAATHVSRGLHMTPDGHIFFVSQSVRRLALFGFMGAGLGMPTEGRLGEPMPAYGHLGVRKVRVGDIVVHQFSPEGAPLGSTTLPLRRVAPSMFAVMTYGVRTSLTGDTLELVHPSSTQWGLGWSTLKAHSVEASQEAFYEFGNANMRPLQRISFRLTDGRKVLAYSRARGFSGSLYFQLSE